MMSVIVKNKFGVKMEWQKKRRKDWTKSIAEALLACVCLFEL